MWRELGWRSKLDRSASWPGVLRQGRWRWKTSVAQADEGAAEWRARASVSPPQSCHDLFWLSLGREVLGEVRFSLLSGLKEGTPHFQGSSAFQTASLFYLLISILALCPKRVH